MFTERRDYLMDLIQQVMQRIAALLLRAQGREVEIDELERDCERAMDDEYAELDLHVRSLQPHSVAEIVQPLDRLRAYALLLAARAWIMSRREAVPAARVEAEARRALGLVLEVTRRVEASPAELDAVRMLSPLVDVTKLGPPQLEALIALAT